MHFLCTICLIDPGTLFANGVNFSMPKENIMKCKYYAKVGSLIPSR